MNKEKKLKVGQQVWLVNSDRRGNDEPEIETKVTKVGKKFFEIDADRHRYSQFFIEDMKLRSVYTTNCRVYLTRQEIADEKECKELSSLIRKEIEGYGIIKLPLEKLRAIYNTIKS